MIIARRNLLKLIMAAPAAMIGIHETANAADTHTVRINGFAFMPERLQAKEGDKIIFVNEDIVPHTATATDESWDTGSLDTGEGAEIILSADMTMDYYCRFHPMMKAVIEPQ